MEKQNESMRDKLLARLPQPENLSAYREETATLLAKHEKATFWEWRFPSAVFMWFAVALWMTINSAWGAKVDTYVRILLDCIAGIMLFTAIINDAGYRISRSIVDLLKEVKQVQLQVLELQASLQKGDKK